MFTSYFFLINTKNDSNIVWYGSKDLHTEQTKDRESFFMQLNVPSFCCQAQINVPIVYVGFEDRYSYPRYAKLTLLSKN